MSADSLGLRQAYEAVLEEIQDLRLALQLQDAAFKETLDALGKLVEAIDVWGFLPDSGYVNLTREEARNYRAALDDVDYAKSIHTKYTQEHPDA